MGLSGSCGELVLKEKWWHRRDVTVNLILPRLPASASFKLTSSLTPRCILRDYVGTLSYAKTHDAKGTWTTDRVSENVTRGAAAEALRDELESESR